MSSRAPISKARELSAKSANLPEVALAVIASYKKQQEVNDFINFLLAALDRNSSWLNSIFGRHNNFRCALMVGAGSNRFQIQEILYPACENEIKLELVMKESADHDKVAIAALFKLSNFDFDKLIKYAKTCWSANTILEEDLLKAKSLGLSFAVLRPYANNMYRLVERIVIETPMKCDAPIKKRRRDDKLLTGPPIKKTRKVLQ